MYCWWQPEIRRFQTCWGESSFSHYLQGFITIPTGGWPWDFWTINSMLEFNMFRCQNTSIYNIRLIECQRLSEDEETTNLKNSVHPKGTFSKPPALILVSDLFGKKTPICVWSCSSHFEVFPSHYFWSALPQNNWQKEKCLDEFMMGSSPLENLHPPPGVPPIFARFMWVCPKIMVPPNHPF